MRAFLWGEWNDKTVTLGRQLFCALQTEKQPLLGNLLLMALFIDGTEWLHSLERNYLFQIYFL